MQSPSFLNRIDQWFFKPSSTHLFTFFRVAVAIFCAVQMIKLYPDLLNIFGEYGFNRADVVAVIQADFMPRIGWLSGPLGDWGIGEVQVIFGLFLHLFSCPCGAGTGSFSPDYSHSRFFYPSDVFWIGKDVYVWSRLFYYFRTFLYRYIAKNTDLFFTFFSFFRSYG